jgi:hypothetical protein
VTDDQRNASWLGLVAGWQLPGDDATAWLSSLDVDDWLTPSVELRNAVVEGLRHPYALLMPDRVLDDLVARGLVTEAQASEHRQRIADDQAGGPGSAHSWAALGRDDLGGPVADLQRLR